MSMHDTILNARLLKNIIKEAIQSISIKSNIKYQTPLYTKNYQQNSAMYTE